MINTLTYKGYTGSVEISEEDNCLHGKVLFIRSLLSYEGQTLSEIKEEFKGVIDEYLEDCKIHNWEPEKPFKGAFNVRVPPSVHRNLAIRAVREGKSLNKLVTEVLTASVA